MLRGMRECRSLWRRIPCFRAYLGCIKRPPAPVSRRTLVSTILFSFSVLQVIGIVMVNDLFRLSATSTDESVSVANVEVEHSPKNPRRSSYSQIVCLSLLSPFQLLGFVSWLELYWPFSFHRI